MPAVRMVRGFLSRWMRDTRDGFWSGLDWLGF